MKCRGNLVDKHCYMGDNATSVRPSRTTLHTFTTIPTRPVTPTILARSYAKQELRTKTLDTTKNNQMQPTYTKSHLNPTHVTIKHLKDMDTHNRRSPPQTPAEACWPAVCDSAWRCLVSLPDLRGASRPDPNRAERAKSLFFRPCFINRPTPGCWSAIIFRRSPLARAYLAPSQQRRAPRPRPATPTRPSCSQIRQPFSR